MTKEQLQTIEARLLALFYDPDYDLRPQICAPFLSDGCVCATETHRMIMINSEICVGEYKPYNLHVSKAIGTNIDLTLTLAEIKSVLERISTQKEMKTIRPEVECKDCDGDGEVEWTYEDRDGYTHTEYYKCPVCNGSGVSTPAKEVPTGRMVPPDDALVGINKRKFIAEHIQALYDAVELLGLDEVRYVSDDERNNVFILTDDIKVIICSCVRGETKAWIKPKINPEKEER